MNKRPRPTAGRPKDLEKRAALLEAAGHLFCEHGFEQVSLDQIAQAAGVSKLTIYSHFGDKTGLFAAAVRARCETQLPHGLFDVPADLPIREALTAIGRAFVALVFADESVRLLRTLAAQGGSANELARIYFAEGPQRSLVEMQAFLSAAIARGQLRDTDPLHAATQFFILLKGVTHMQVVLGLRDAPAEPEMTRHIARSVDLFLHGYAPLRG